MKYIITEEQLNKIYNSYLDYLFDGIYEVSSGDFPDSRFWKKGDEIVLEFQKTGELWVLRSIYITFLNTFSLGGVKTQIIIKNWLEEHLNLKGVTSIGTVVAISNSLLEE